MRAGGPKVNSDLGAATRGNETVDVILFISMPWTGKPALLNALGGALGADAVGWVGRTVTREEIRKGLPRRNLRVLCGQIDLALAERLRNVSLVATLIPAPHTIPVAEYASARDRPRHKHHAIANTLFLEEVLQEGHVFADDLVNVVTRRLTPPGAAPSVDAALAALSGRPSLVGLSAHPGAFAEAFSRALGLPKGAIPASLFATPSRPDPRGETARVLATANAMDRALHDAVRARLGERSRVWRCDAAAPAR